MSERDDRESRPAPGASSGPGSPAAMGTEKTVLAGDDSSGHSSDPPANQPERLPAGGRTSRILPVDVGTVLGRYKIREELGAGGMATVYLARDLELRRDVAVKVLFPHLCKRREVVARFQREARAAAKLDHPHILRVYDVGGGEARTTGHSDDDSADRVVIEPPYIVMELVRGRSLHDVFSEWDSLPLAEIVACVGVVMCEALSEAHAAGIVHRDVKPANIMVADGGWLALTDFGVARIEDEDSSLVTRAGSLLGTPAFMSPEQALGSELSARSDVYSLGATLYRLATGSTPFSGPTARLVSAITRGQKKPALMLNPAMGGELSGIIERMMARQPDDRYPDCKSAGQALAHLLTRASLGAPVDELAAFFADPDGYQARQVPVVAQATLAHARTACREREIPLALALCDRVLALAPDGEHASAAMKLVERIGQGQRRVRWLLASVLMAGVAVTAWFALGWLPGWFDDPGRLGQDAALDAPGDAALDAPGDAALDAPGATDMSMPDAHERIASTSGHALPRRRPRPHARSSTMDAAPPPPVHLDAAPPAIAVDAAPPPALAIVTLDMHPWCNVRINGKDHGRATRDREIELPPGVYDIECSQGHGRPGWRRRITLSPGQRLALEGSVLSEVRITVGVKTGDRLRMAGKVHPNGTSFAIAPGRYRVDILSGQDVVRGAYLSIPALRSCTIRDRPTLDCYP